MVGRRFMIAAFLLAAASPAASQEHAATVRFRVVAEDSTPVAGAELLSGMTRAHTGADGTGLLRLAPGRQTVVVRAFGHAEDTRRLVLGPRVDTTLHVVLRATAIEAEAIVVQSTRSERRIEEEPVRVEVLGREEIEEKMLMTPGDISMMLNETSGLRVQTTSPSLGGANVRIQGLRGRYTQILSDGLPLYGGQSGALSMLQIPPMDLGQVEVIKGVASALYGSSALGGVVNLLSRRPAGEREILLNQTTRGGSDAILWSSGDLGDRWGYTFLGSGHRQGAHDVDGDAWADLPGFTRGVARPRWFWNDGAGRSFFVTVGATAERRQGGTLDGRAMPDGSPYAESLDTRRVDAGLSGRVLLGTDHLLSVRASVMRQGHEHFFGATAEQDVHATAFTEVALTGTDGGHAWVLGAAWQYEGYENRDVARFDYTYSTPALFVQDEFSPAPWLTLAASGRLDRHSEYGTILNPRISLLLRPDESWNARASVGTGYFAPTPFTEETEVIGLARVRSLDLLDVESARSVSLDVGRQAGPFELNATLFGSEVRDPLLLRRVGDGTVELFNAREPTRTSGTDLLLRYHEEPFHVTATYTYTRSTEPDPESGRRRAAPLAPRHTAGVVGMWEAEAVARVGVEFYYTGRQRLVENPYREESRPYVVLGFLAERRFGRARVFLNAENLLDARQTRWDPLLLPARSPEGRWTTDVWAPLDGRTLNAGVRLDL